MRGKTKRFAAVLVGGAALVLAACGGGSSSSSGGDEGDPVYGGTITVGLEAESTGLRPWEDSCASPCSNMMNTIYDTLTVNTKDEGYKPYLAESVTVNADLTEWTVKLRSGVTFHNGVELTAQTLLDMFPIQQKGTAAGSAINSAGVTGITKVDDLTVTYTLKAPYAGFSADLSGSSLGRVFEPAAAAADPAGYSLKPIGTGPFKIETRDVDNETVVVKYENYWGKDQDGNQLPYLDKIIFKPTPDEQQRLTALVSGTVDAFQTLRQGTIRDARSSDGLKLTEFQGNNTGGGMFNTQVPPLDDKRVRVALNMANSQEAVINALGGTGISAAATQWFSPDSPWYSEKARDSYPKYDIAAATAMLQEYIDDPARSDGKKPGDKIYVELNCPPDPTLVAAMQVISAGWNETGLVDVRLGGKDQSAHINDAVGDKHAAHCWRWGGQGDPQAGIQAFFAASADSVANFTNFDDPAIATKAKAAGENPDFAARKAVYEELMILINEEGLLWYSGHTATAIVSKPNVNGFLSWTSPDGSAGIGIPDAVVNWAFVWVGQ